MQLIISVNCTSKKTVKAAKSLCARDLARGDVAHLAKEWRSRVEVASAQQIPARELYSGRAFALARKTAQKANADLYVLSAGMGLVNQDKLLPPYNLSVAPTTDDCILLRSLGEPFTAAQWWTALHEVQDSRPLAKLLSQRANAMLILAATRPYIEMVKEELLSLTTAQMLRLRIVGPTRVEDLPELLRPSVMPYDGRIDDADLGLQGTRFDFAARALTHFVGLVGDDECVQSPQDHAKRVRLSLSKRRAPERLQRVRIDATELRRHVRALKKAGESRTSALERLRRDLGYACEQQRFANVWDAL